MKRTQRAVQGSQGSADDPPEDLLSPGGAASALPAAGHGQDETQLRGSDNAVTLPEDDGVAHEAASLPSNMTVGGFGTLLEPVLRRACDDRLSSVTWFRTDWQRGGAATGYATYHADDGKQHHVVVKLPVPPCERHWLVNLQPFDHAVPRIYAHGDALNGYDLAWVVMERLNHGPLGSAWGGKEFDLLTDAAGRFYAAAAEFPLKGQRRDVDWQAVLDRARRAAREQTLPDAHRWSSALKKAHRKLKRWLTIWHDRHANDWCHGDLHLGNALTRTPAPHGPALLIDFAHTRVGHWVEDAVYFEHLYWGRRDRLAGRKLCKMVGQMRKTLGLTVDADWPRLAQVKRTLLAMSTPIQLHHGNDPAHLRAALAVLEAEV